MKKLLLIASLLAFASGANAQTSIAVNIHTAKLLWDWTQGAAPNDGIPTEYRIRCTVNGTVIPFSTVSYTLPGSTTVPGPKEVKIEALVGGPGAYSCTVSAANAFGETAPTAAVNFTAGSIPVAPSNLRIQAQ